jgi:hypothetical protein
MGFASIVLYMMVFLGAMIAIFGMTGNYADFLSQSKDITESELGTVENIEVLNASYADGTTVAWLENSGQDPIELDDVDIYLDGTFIPRDDDNRTFGLIDVKNPGLWDPGEEMMTTISMSLDNGISELKVTGSQKSASINITVGTMENETLAVSAGQWSPVLGGTVLTAGELLAINNAFGTNLTLDAAKNESMGLETADTSFGAYEVLATTIIIDYKALDINDGEFTIEGRDTTYDGNLHCSGSYGNMSGVNTTVLDCSGLTPTELQNIYIVLNNTASDGRDIWLDYLRVNTTYIR